MKKNTNNQSYIKGKNSPREAPGALGKKGLTDPKKTSGREREKTTRHGHYRLQNSRKRVGIKSRPSYRSVEKGRDKESKQGR